MPGKFHSAQELRALAESTLVAEDGRIQELVNNALGYLEKVSAERGLCQLMLRIMSNQSIERVSRNI